MILFTITGLIVWIFLLVLGGLILWDNIPAKVKTFFPNLCYVISSLWGDAYSKLSDLKLLIARKEGNTNWFMRAAKWILNERVSK